MKCPNCGKEIAEDSLFCEFCGTKLVQDQPKTTQETLLRKIGTWETKINQKLPIAKKKWFYWAIGGIALGIIAILILLCIPRDYKYVDLGLPSGTKWAFNKEEGSYTYDEAVAMFGDRHLPSERQFTELLNECKWKWNGSYFSVFGPNGKYICLDTYWFEGSNNYGNPIFEPMEAGRYGYYWDRGEGILYIDSEFQQICTANKEMKFSVILVK